MWPREATRWEACGLKCRQSPIESPWPCWLSQWPLLVSVSVECVGKYMSSDSGALRVAEGPGQSRRTHLILSDLSPGEHGSATESVPSFQAY